MFKINLTAIPVKKGINGFSEKSEKKRTKESMIDGQVIYR